MQFITCIHSCVYIYIHRYICTNTHIYIYINIIHTYMHTRTCIHVEGREGAYIYVCVRAYTHMYTYMHTDREGGREGEGGAKSLTFKINFWPFVLINNTGQVDIYYIKCLITNKWLKFFQLCIQHVQNGWLIIAFCLDMCLWL